MVVSCFVLSWLFFGLPLLNASSSETGPIAVLTEQAKNPARGTKEALKSAIMRGEIDPVKKYLESGGDVNLTWKDTPYTIQMSLVLRAVWYGKEDIFNYILSKGADLQPVQDYIAVPVRAGQIVILKTLLSRGLKLPTNSKILMAIVESRSLPILKLVTSYAPELWLDSPALNAVPVFIMTDEMIRFLVPKYLKPSRKVYLGDSACEVLELIAPSFEHSDGCEGTVGPLWMHYVLKGKVEMVKFFMQFKVDVHEKQKGYAPTGESFEFTALDIATKKDNKVLIQLLKR